jgi:hypothetical protein
LPGLRHGGVEVAAGAKVVEVEPRGEQGRAACDRGARALSAVSTAGACPVLSETAHDERREQEQAGIQRVELIPLDVPGTPSSRPNLDRRQLIIAVLKREAVFPAAHMTQSERTARPYETSAIPQALVVKASDSGQATSATDKRSRQMRGRRACDAPQASHHARGDAVLEGPTTIHESHLMTSVEHEIVVAGGPPGFRSGGAPSVSGSGTSSARAWPFPEYS